MYKSKKRIDLILISYSEALAQHLVSSKYFNLKVVITSNKYQYSNDIYNMLILNQIEYYHANSIIELSSLLNKLQIKNILMYQFKYIIPSILTKKFNIFNIHPGSLFHNRGANPIVWSILLGERETYLSLHKIDEKIDAGFLISEVKITITDSDDSKTLRDKIESNFHQVEFYLFKYLIYNHSVVKMIDNNGYRRRVRNEDFTLDLKNDNLLTISRKIRSQKLYRGAILIIDGICFYVSDFEEAKINQ